jgi:MFS family permease
LGIAVLYAGLSLNPFAPHKTDAYLITTLGLLSVAVCMPITGYLSDIWGAAR